LELKNDYNSNYLGLKEKFNLPNRVNFGFSLIFDDNSKIEGLRNVPRNTEVYSASGRVEVLRKDGKIEFANLVVRIW
jgi:hypothetical protein